MTYALHALLWMLVASMVARGSVSSAAEEHGLWRLALVGPTVTTASALVISIAPDLFATSRAAATATVGLAADHSARLTLLLPARFLGAAPLIVCALAIVVGAARYAFTIARFAFALRRRSIVGDPHLRNRLEVIRTRLGLPFIRLSESPSVASPVLLWGAEICLPAGKLARFPTEEVDAIFAHELAHLERRDHIWFALAGLVQACSWIAPTVHRVALRLRETAELACDDRAATITGDGWTLASALTRMASVGFAPGNDSPVPAMLRARGHVVLRVERLVGPVAPRTKPARDRRWALAAMFVAACAATALHVRLVPAGLRSAAEPAQLALPSPQPSSADAATASEKLSRLAARERRIASRLEASLQLPGADQENTPALTGVRELRQQLRHVREEQILIEQRFVHATEDTAPAHSRVAAPAEPATTNEDPRAID